MAKFEHKYASLVLQDEDGVWARFSPGIRRTSTGGQEPYGVLETDDTKLTDRLRRLIAAGTDPHLREIDPPAPRKTSKAARAE